LNKNAAVQETRSKAFSLTRLAPERYAAGMRPLTIPLAVVALMTLVGPSRAEFDSGGIGPVKPKATQPAGTTFDASMATRRLAGHLSRSQFQRLLLRELACLQKVKPLVVRTIKLDGPQPIIKNPSNIPRPRRPANLPPACVW
jgi:hypothetical protein